MSAKMLAFATGCSLLAVETFAAISAGATAQAANLDVIADAQQDNVYAQRFGTHPAPLVVAPFDVWLESARAWNAVVAGPGLEVFRDRIPADVPVLDKNGWHAQPAHLLKLGLARF